MMILASIIWIPAIRKPFPNQIQGMVPLLICLFVFTVNPMVGTALGNAIAGINGTFWACFHMWFMNGIFPGGMKEGMSPTSACAIFGWANFLIFLWLTLWCKCGLGTKMFFSCHPHWVHARFPQPSKHITLQRKLHNLHERHCGEHNDSDLSWNPLSSSHEPPAIPDELCLHNYERECREGIHGHGEVVYIHHRLLLWH